MTMFTREYMLTHAAMRDKNCDGKFITGVHSTGIYCLPSCPARNPKAENIRFYRTEREAKKAGLRACKRCKPDDFYRGYDEDLDLVRELMARVRKEPQKYPTAAAVTRSSGIGNTKLNQLFRKHYHRTPAEYLAQTKIQAAAELLDQPGAGVLDAALGAGFENSSTFHLQFKRTMFLSPGKYKNLGADNSFTLSLPEDYRAPEIVAYLTRDPTESDNRLTDKGMAKALEFEGTPAVMYLDFGNGEVQVRLEGMAPNRANMRFAHRIGLRLLGLQMDPKPFLTRIQSEPKLAPLIVGREGLRVPQTLDFFEGLVWTIVGQQINLNFAYRLRSTLIERWGKPSVDGLHTHPSPQAIANLDYADLTGLQFSKRKAEYLIDTARLVVEGKLQPERWEHAGAGEIEKELCAIRGIGSWTARYLLLRCFGFADSFPLGDAGLAAALQSYFSLEKKPDRETCTTLMEPFSPYRGLASFYLWQYLKERTGKTTASPIPWNRGKTA